METLRVAAPCPSCAAPLEFGEDTHAIVCGFCRSSLFLSDEGEIPRYRVDPKMDAREAMTMLRFQLSGTGRSPGVEPPALWLVPYFRFRAEEIREEPAAREPVAVPGLEELLEQTDRRTELHDRYIARNFLALEDTAGVAFPYSLGVRPGVVQLRLAPGEVSTGEERVVEPTLRADDAASRGRRSPARKALRRVLLRTRLSLVYFPFWIAPVRGPTGEAVAVIDAVASRILDAEGDPARLPATVDGWQDRRLPLRNHLCPNCGWDLPVRGEDALFVCRECGRAWEWAGTRWLEVAVGSWYPRESERPGSTRNLPFWMLRDAAGSRALVPAFACRRLRSLAELGRRFLGVEEGAPGEDEGQAPSSGVGVRYGRADARELGAFLDVADPFRVERLVHVAFEERAYSLIDPIWGTGIAKNALPDL